MTKKLILALYILLAAASYAQESNSVFNFLEMPVSAHSTALGGRNISLIEDDASLVFSNPALLSSVSDKTLNLNFMTYLQGCNVGSAAFVKILGERSTMGVTAQYAHYGTMDEITADNVTVGSFSAMDMALSGMYAYNLNDRWAGGATGKFIYSKYGDYSSVALAVDLGVNYYNENTDFSLSAVARNLGGQVVLGVCQSETEAGKQDARTGTKTGGVGRACRLHFVGFPEVVTQGQIHVVGRQEIHARCQMVHEHLAGR